MPWDWVTFPEFLDSVDRTPKGVNVMAFVPLAPLYGYVAGVDKAKAYRVTDEELDEMCRLLVEAMEAGALRVERADRGRARQRAARLRRHADGHRLHDRARGRPPSPVRSARSAAASCSSPASLDTAALIARESGRPIIWNALLADGALNQHGGGEYSHRDALEQLAVLQRGGGAARLRAGAHDELRLGVHLRGLQPPRHDPGAGRKHSSARSRRSGPSSPIPSAATAMKEIHEARGGLFGAGYVLERDQGQLDLE